MATVSSSTQNTAKSGIHSSTELTRVIYDFEDANNIIRGIEHDAGKAQLVKAIDIDNQSDPEDEKLAAYLNAREDLARFKFLSDKAEFAFTQLVITILKIVSDADGMLTHFNWSDGWVNHRVPEYLATLLPHHAPSLQELSLGFAPRELNAASIPPDTAFPQLKRLEINAYMAHDDSGSLISTILSNSPGLQYLDFTWPSCDLNTCQIRDIDWGLYSFPELQVLKATGWNFDRYGFHHFKKSLPKLKESKIQVSG